MDLVNLSILVTLVRHHLAGTPTKCGVHLVFERMPPKNVSYRMVSHPTLVSASTWMLRSCPTDLTLTHIIQVFVSCSHIPTYAPSVRPREGRTDALRCWVAS